MNIQQCRADTPGCKQRIHFNNAGSALMPKPVLDAVLAYLNLESEIGGYEAAEQRAGAIGMAYDQIARLIHAFPEEISLMANATDAYNKALTSIPYEKGDVILTTRNDYISNQLALLALQKRFGVQIVRVGDLPEGGVDVDDMKRCVHRLRPKLVSVTHVPTNSGLIQPVEEIGMLLKDSGIPYLVDACQSAGQLDVDVRRIHCDFLSVTGRKFIRGPRGTGFLFVSKKMLEKGVAPLTPDMRGARWTSEDDYRLVSSARRFEDWENPYALIIGLARAVEYANSLGIPAIQDRVISLARQLRNGLMQLTGARILDRGARLCGIVTVHLAGIKPQELHQHLQHSRINAGLSLRQYALLDFKEKGVKWALRLSPHYYNTTEEIEACLEILQTFVKEKGDSRQKNRS